MTPELKSVSLKTIPDPDAPLDHLGHYQDEPGPQDRTIDRAERGDKRRGWGEFRYFVSATAEYAEENYERMEKYASGHVASYGIRAVATVSTTGTVQTIESPGLWGIPSDAATDHAGEVASEQLHVLREILDALGIDHPDPLEAEWTDDSPWRGTETE